MKSIIKRHRKAIFLFALLFLLNLMLLILGVPAIIPLMLFIGLIFSAIYYFSDEILTWIAAVNPKTKIFRARIVGTPEVLDRFEKVVPQYVQYQLGEMKAELTAVKTELDKIKQQNELKLRMNITRKIEEAKENLKRNFYEKAMRIQMKEKDVKVVSAIDSTPLGICLDILNHGHFWAIRYKDIYGKRKGEIIQTEPMLFQDLFPENMHGALSTAKIIPIYFNDAGEYTPPHLLGVKY